MSSAVPSQVNILVTDMERSVAFYRLLGLEFGDTAPEWQEWHQHHRSMNSADGDFHLDLDSEPF
ncbi:MAG: VOC family protein, partial [Streptosporangiaceae bacterium]